MSVITPGFVSLHGNQLEQLRAAVFDWLRANPLDPLEQEIFLVQSNGVSEWLKIALAAEAGVCAATRVTLPARFTWEIYRGVLGREQVAGKSTFDRSSLVWRLMQLLPGLLEDDRFAPLRFFLRDGQAERRLQLAQRLADLMDQYQVYRTDWLGDWAAGRDVLRTPKGQPVALAEDQRWQAALWRALIDHVPEAQRNNSRVDIHNRFLAAMAAGAQPAGRLPRRVVLFGVSTLPYQTMQVLGALAGHTQVMLAVLNPSQYYWGDIIQGNDLLTAARRRQSARAGVAQQVAGDDLFSTAGSASAAEAIGATVHGHPLLASWGRQGRDFVRMLDEFDDVEATRMRFSNLRVDLFSEGEGDTLLTQVHAAVRDLLSLQDHAQLPVAQSDRSIEFHIAHSVQREVEVLHDRLLMQFAANGDLAASDALKPRDIVVMVPDIGVFMPAIRAVFGQHAPHDPRYIPFEIADLKERSVNPLLVALEWLLRLPQQRSLQSEVSDLLNVPALAARFGLDENDLPRVVQWIQGAGIRWGLDLPHRAGLGLEAVGEQNAWIFGIRRMLLGYASGAEADFAGIEPYAEVAGLEATLAGALAHFVDMLVQWRGTLSVPATPAVWGERARALLAAFFAPQDERDRLTFVLLEEALQRWLGDCSEAGYAESLPLSVMREAWLGAVDEPNLNQRFVSGGVTFCTLMPMRAVPFRMVCLLGMNDGDFPRRAQHADFDLLALPGQARPGDRSRRDDDRYLMLEALLAARDKLYISWVGRNVRDNSEQPPSVLVSQLRDYLAAGWQLDLATLTTEHPLQPFSRKYFEQGGLLTYAREWRGAHDAAISDVANDALPPYVPAPDFRLTLADLAQFVREPVKYFFRQRLQVSFDRPLAAAEDGEPFALDGLANFQLAAAMLRDGGPLQNRDEVAVRLAARAARLGREGVLPIGAFGSNVQAQLVNELTPVRHAWLDLCARYPGTAGKLPVTLDEHGLLLDDWIDGLIADGAAFVWLAADPKKLTGGKNQAPRGPHLIAGWIRQLAAAAMGHAVTGHLVGRDAAIVMRPLEPAQSRATLALLMQCWLEGMGKPLPVACNAALALLAGEDARAAYDGSFTVPGEVDRDACLARLWPDYAALAAEAQWPVYAQSLYGAFAAWMQNDIDIAMIADAQEEEGAA